MTPAWILTPSRYARRHQQVIPGRDLMEALRGVRQTNVQSHMPCRLSYIGMQESAENLQDVEEGEDEEGVDDRQHWRSFYLDQGKVLGIRVLGTHHHGVLQLRMLSSQIHHLVRLPAMLTPCPGFHRFRVDHYRVFGPIAVLSPKTTMTWH